MLIYYTAGYVARKVLKTTQCQTCVSYLTTERHTAIASDPVSSFTAHFDNGRLMYPSVSLKKAVSLLEESFTTFFSLNTWLLSTGKPKSKNYLSFFYLTIAWGLPSSNCRRKATQKSATRNVRAARPGGALSLAGALPIARQLLAAPPHAVIP